MRKSFTCVRGHRWEASLDEALVVAGIACPQCGSPAQTVIADDGPGLNGTSPQLDGGGKRNAECPPMTPNVDVVGRRIGPYKLLQKIGEGGMGAVYMAEQEHPVRRRVALKIIKPGMDSDQVIARFESERQALALMDHQNIARVLDAGTTDIGHPYFVMELVKGVPITKYADDNRLSPRERLQLFIPVCQAIQHAHQKGIIHRDIKPSNILVTPYDGKPVPKVIDFGVAKATDQKLTERTMFTQFGQVIGTLEYMSPEQAEMNALDVDTRSDIYSLGVVLYELLTGNTPLDRDRMRTAALHEVLRFIREEEPPRPSARLSKSGDVLATVSAQRRMEPAKLARLMRGELDWIVMKALEKDRTRRYETANGFARDIERYLADEPVEACPPSSTYKLLKLGRKYRKTLVTAAGFALVMLSAIVISTGLAIWALRAESQANRAAHEATVQAAIAKSVNDFLEKDLLQPANPYFQPVKLPPELEGQSTPPELTVREALDRASYRLLNQFAEQPLVEASVRRTIGTAYMSLGEAVLARPHLERALELYRRVLSGDHPDTLQLMSQLSLVLGQLGGPYITIIGNDGTRTSADDEWLRLKAEQLAKQAVEASQRALGDNHLTTIMCITNLGALYDSQGNRGLAEPHWIQALELSTKFLGDEHDLTLQAKNNRAWLYMCQDRYELALPLLVEIVDVSRTTMGQRNPQRSQYLNNLAAVCRKLGQSGLEDDARFEALEISHTAFGPKGPSIFGTKSQLDLHFNLMMSQLKPFGSGQRTDNFQEQLVVLYNKKLKYCRRLFGDHSFETDLVMLDLAEGYESLAAGLAAQGQGERAQELRAKSEALFQEVNHDVKVNELNPHSNKNRAELLRRLAEFKERRGDSELAEPIWMDLLELQKYAWLWEDGSPADVAETLNVLGINRQQQKKYSMAEEALVECVTMYEEKFFEPWLNAKSLLAEPLLAQQKYEAAEAVLLQAHHGLKHRLESQHGESQEGTLVSLRETLERLVTLYSNWEKPDEAKKWQIELKSL